MIHTINLAQLFDKCFSRKSDIDKAKSSTYKKHGSKMVTRTTEIFGNFK